MKKTALLVLSAMILTPAFAAEPLLLAPLQTTVLSSAPATYDATTTQVEYKSPIGGGVYEATYTPSVSAAYNYGENMVPQNAAAKGEPVPVQTEPRVRIQTKQRSQGNSYWNPGGKGTKSYF
jgi:hypothetical protein